MIPKQGTWADLDVGAYMRDKNGETWRVDREREGHLLIVNREGRRVHITPRDPRTAVTLLVPTEQEAVTTLEQKLDAQTLARRRNGEKVWEVGPWRTQGAGCMVDARTHLHLFHGTHHADIKNMAGLTEAHDYFHENPDHGAGYVPHTH